MIATLDHNQIARVVPSPRLSIGRPAYSSRPGRSPASFCECGDHAFSAINKGLTILVSPEDVGVLSIRWTATVGPTGYATISRSFTVAPKTQKKVVLARYVMGAARGEEVDHVNGCSLDNRRQNLRLCDRLQNAKNKKLQRSNSTGLKGVRRNRNKFTAYIRSDNVRHYLGSFPSAEDAHAAYVEAAKRLHGEFARFE